MKEISIEQLKVNPVTLIGGEWALLTAGNKENGFNTMTVSWGHIGELWNKPTTVVYVRPQRYTKEFVDANDTFTLTFFDGNYMKELGYLGKVSGRDEDKIAKSGLHVEMVDGQPTFEEASQVLVCKKLYHDTMKPENFYGTEEDEKWYLDKDYHTMYIAEIVAAYEK